MASPIDGKRKTADEAHDTLAVEDIRDIKRTREGEDLERVQALNASFDCVERYHAVMGDLCASLMNLIGEQGTDAVARSFEGVSAKTFREMARAIQEAQAISGPGENIVKAYALLLLLAKSLSSIHFNSHTWSPAEGPALKTPHLNKTDLPKFMGFCGLKLKEVHGVMESFDTYMTHMTEEVKVQKLEVTLIGCLAQLVKDMDQAAERAKVLESPELTASTHGAIIARGQSSPATP